MKKLLAAGLKPKILSLPANLLNLSLLYWLCAALFALQIIRIFLVMFSPSEQLNSLGFSLFLYLIFLVLYALRQFIDKIKGKVGKKMRGWIFVLLWLVFVISLCVTQSVTHGRYKVPAAAFENLMIVISVFCGRNIARLVWRRKTKGTKGIRAYIILIFFGRKMMEAYCRQRIKQSKEKRPPSRPWPNSTRKGILHGAFRL